MGKGNKPHGRGKGGRPPKTDTAKNCVMVRFTDEEHVRFRPLFEQAGLFSKAAFVKARVFGEEFHVIRSDHGTMEYAGTTDCIQRPIPKNRRELQSSREGTTHAFLTEKSSCVTL